MKHNQRLSFEEWRMKKKNQTWNRVISILSFRERTRHLQEKGVPRLLMQVLKFERSPFVDLNGRLPTLTNEVIDQKLVEVIKAEADVRVHLSGYSLMKVCHLKSPVKEIYTYFQVDFQWQK
jgi:hypothetical protein